MLLAGQLRFAFRMVVMAIEKEMSLFPDKWKEETSDKYYACKFSVHVNAINS